MAEPQIWSELLTYELGVAPWGTGGGQPQFRAGELPGLAGDQRADDLLIHAGSRVVSNSRCQAERRSGDVSPPSNQTPVRARDTAT